MFLLQHFGSFGSDQYELSHLKNKTISDYRNYNDQKFELDIRATLRKLGARKDMVFLMLFGHFRIVSP